MKNKLVIILTIFAMTMGATACGTTQNTSVTTSGSASIGAVAESGDNTDTSDLNDEQVSPTDYSHLDFTFASEDIFGEAISSDIYSKNKLTLVNIFATWCPPCIEELPYLAQLNEEFSDQGLQIIGFVTDTKVYETSALAEEALSSAKELYEKSGVTYPFIVPDDTFLGGLLFVQYVPTSVFLDENGKMVGDPVVGANSLEGWKEIITERLNSL